MRIRFVTLYFPPEVGAAQRRISELARRLAIMGHHVTVVTGFPNYPSGIKPPGYGGKLIMKEALDGYNIIRLPIYVTPNKGFAKRLMIHLSFALSATVYSLFMKADDVIYIESPPLFNGFIGLLTKWFRRIPYVFNVADLWPQTAIELGLLNNRVIIYGALLLEKIFYRNASRILAITRGLSDWILSKGYPENKVPLITNGVDPEVFNETVTPDKELLRYKKPGALLAVYAGTHGLVYSLETLLGAARLLKDENIFILLIGDGSDKNRIMKLAEDWKLANVDFLPARPPSDMPAVFRAADVAVISLRDLEISRAIMPAKCFEIMSAGVPLVYAARGEMAGHIANAGCGKIIEPENPQRLYQTLLEFRDMGELKRQEMGNRGREYIKRNFALDIITDRLEAVLQEVVEDAG